MGPQNVKNLGPWGPRILKFWGPGGPKMGGPYFHMTPADDVLPFPTGHLLSSVSPATIKRCGQ